MPAVLTGSVLNARGYPEVGRIALAGLGVRYGEGKARRAAAVQGVNLEILPGQFIALVGPSGCGKTTVLNAVAGFIAPTEGTVEIDGEPVRGPSAQAGVVFQQHSLFPWMTALENVAFGPRELGLPDPRAIARRYLSLVGLGDFADAYPATLSGGMRQRVGLARALATEPPVLLMDEPFGALDALTRELMQELLLGIWGKKPHTVVFITHDVEEAVFLADRVVVMGAQPGRVREIVPVELPRPRSAAARGDPRLARLRAEIGELIREESRRHFQGGLEP